MTKNVRSDDSGNSGTSPRSRIYTGKLMYIYTRGPLSLIKINLVVISGAGKVVKYYVIILRFRKREDQEPRGRT